jgi:Sec7-like guanine-nucleotide exchange factor
MKPYEAYTTYLAMKNHFEKDGYDFFRYGGKVTAKVESFYARKDKYFFEKLARKDDLVNFMMANFLEKEKVWSRDLVQEDADKIYRDWVKRTQSLSYLFKSDLEKIEDLRAAVRVVEGQHPELLKMYMQKRVNPETILIIDSFSNIMRAWDEKIADPVIWPAIRRKLQKYKPFFKFDKDKMKEIIVSRYVKAAD